MSNPLDFSCDTRRTGKGAQLSPRLRTIASLIRYLWVNARGSQIAEFAIAIPFLMVIVVGIFDFGTAFNTKDESHERRE